MTGGYDAAMGMSPGLGVIGRGAVSPFGWGFPALLDGVRGGAGALSSPRRSELRALAGRLVGEVPGIPAGESARLPDARRMAMVSRYAFAAGREALAAAGRTPAAGSKRGDVALLLTTTHGAAQQTIEFAETLRREGPSRVSPMLFSTSVLNAPASHLSQGLGLTGPCHTVIAESDGWDRLLLLVPALLGSPGVTSVLAVAAAELDATVIEAYGRAGRAGPFGEGAAAAVFERAAGTSVTLAPAATDLGAIRESLRAACGEAFSTTEAWAWMMALQGQE